jgi:hypothetical protein
MKSTIIGGGCLVFFCIVGTAYPIPPHYAVETCADGNCASANCGNRPCYTGACQQMPPNPIAPGRPSPPPCCADGISYARPETWGFYETRWRRWSVEYAVSAPDGVVPPGGAVPDVRTYETPRAEEEDLRAPAPTTPREEPVENGGAQQPGPQSPNGLQPGPAAPSSVPAPTGTGSPLRNLPAYEPQSPGLRSPDTGSPQSPSTQPDDAPQTPPTRPLSTGIPTSDLDLPPALPIGMRSVYERPMERSAGTPARITPQQPSRSGQQPPANDPPPALPTTLASLGR